MPFAPIPEILDELRAGRMVVLTDDEDRENEGDLVLPAQFVTPEAITFMLTVARGYLCVSLTEADCDRLDLHPQSSTNTTVRGTAFTVSLDLHPKHGGTTGVSAKERARCIAMLTDPAFGKDDFVRPGHINPLRSRNGGVLVRTGQTEGSLDLCRLAGLHPAAVIIEVMRDDGEMARLPDLQQLCARHNLKMCSVAQIISHRLARESLVRRLPPVSGTPVRTPMGTFNLVAFESMVDPLPHLALCVGDVGAVDAAGRAIENPAPALVRMHRRHTLGDIFSVLDASSAGPTSDTLRASMQMIQQAGRGALVYLRPEGGAGNAPTDGPTAALESLINTLRHRHAPVPDPDTPDLVARLPADHAMAGVPRHMREFGIGVQILRQLGLRSVRLISNHRTELPGLDAFGLEIAEYVPVAR
ncbi:MAG: 3,4-dihydroxy-2-butanone-4-phosphate synthase [Planctomycetaceae bacterium]|jgi:3,4-dihydroxy 2-butanone 4-phosphate synthase/GTP cyclohydrolase II|nr:3,4-dihydroxy-2-butanone-4-phosphate synthase [Phycisphaerales bacterium]MCE2654474.1 3,4-dihydroxy-2-butanone-4-phosphate synthase [Planctomycetaceae bacterium]